MLAQTSAATSFKITFLKMLTWKDPHLNMAILFYFVDKCKGLKLIHDYSGAPLDDDNAFQQNRCTAKSSSNESKKPIRMH